MGYYVRASKQYINIRRTKISCLLKYKSMFCSNDDAIKITALFYWIDGKN